MSSKVNQFFKNQLKSLRNKDMENKVGGGKDYSLGSSYDLSDLQKIKGTISDKEMQYLKSMLPKLGS
jgi:hypothetical protein